MMPLNIVIPAKVTPKGVIPEAAKQLSGISYGCDDINRSHHAEIPAYAGMTPVSMTLGDRN